MYHAHLRNESFCIDLLKWVFFNTRLSQKYISYNTYSTMANDKAAAWNSTDGRAADSGTRGPGFKSCHQWIFSPHATACHKWKGV